MQFATPNQTLFALSGAGLEACAVLAIETLTPVGVNLDYAIQLTLPMIDKGRLIAALDKPLCLKISNNAYVHGVVASFESNKATGQTQLCLRSPLYPLTQIKKSQIFYQRDMTSLLKSLLPLPVECKLTTPLGMQVQYQETDLAFIMRVLRENKLVCCFKQTELHASLLVTDQLNELNLNDPLSFIHLENAGLVTNAFQLTDLTETQDILSGTTFEARTYYPGIQVGQLIMVNDPDLALCVVSVSHEGDELEAGKRRYYNTIILKRLLDAEHPSTIQARIDPGYLQARIEASVIDEQGRYIIRYDFDNSSLAEVQSGAPATLMQPLASETGGFHFPLPVGARVIVKLIEGDWQRPVIIGSLPDEAHSSPVNQQNPHQHIWQTSSGQHLLMDEQERLIELATGSSSFALQDKPDQIMIKAQDVVMKTSNDINQTTKGTWTQEVGGSHTTQAGEFKTAAQGDVTLFAKEDIALTSTSEARWHAGAEIALHTQDKLTIDAKTLHLSGKGICVEGRDLTLKAANGLYCQAAGSLSFSQAGAAIRIDASGVISIEAPKVLIKAELAIAQGKRVDL